MSTEYPRWSFLKALFIGIPSFILFIAILSFIAGILALFAQYVASGINIIAVSKPVQQFFGNPSTQTLLLFGIGALAGVGILFLAYMFGRFVEEYIRQAKWRRSRYGSNLPRQS